MIQWLQEIFGLKRTRPLWREMSQQYEMQKLLGVDMNQYANADGRIEARVCDCGLYRRDFPPGTYVCGCGRALHSNTSQKRLMCHSCSAKIIDGRSSYASYYACSLCLNVKV